MYYTTLSNIIFVVCFKGALQEAHLQNNILFIKIETTQRFRELQRKKTNKV